MTESCWLCRRALGRRVQRHHMRPKSCGGRETAPVHPICHRMLHARFTNAELARLTAADLPPTGDAEIERFVAWIADKPPDFHAPTRQRVLRFDVDLPIGR